MQRDRQKHTHICLKASIARKAAICRAGVLVLSVCVCFVRVTDSVFVKKRCEEAEVYIN